MKRTLSILLHYLRFYLVLLEDFIQLGSDIFSTVLDIELRASWNGSFNTKKILHKYVICILPIFITSSLSVFVLMNETVTPVQLITIIIIIKMEEYYNLPR